MYLYKNDAFFFVFLLFPPFSPLAIQIFSIYFKTPCIFVFMKKIYFNNKFGNIFQCGIKYNLGPSLITERIKR